jgi:hypothetical protein
MVSYDRTLLTRLFFESLKGPEGKLKAERAVQASQRLPPSPRLWLSRMEYGSKLKGPLIRSGREPVKP